MAEQLADIHNEVKLSLVGMAEQRADIHSKVKLFFNGNGRTAGRYPQ